MATDVVYLVRDGPNEELRFSLRSLVNVEHDRVWVVGHKPRWVRKVEHLPTRQDDDRYANTLAGVLTACAHVDEFQLWNDDFYALAPTEVPVWHLGPIQPDQYSGCNHPGGRQETARLLKSWGIDPVLDYAVHVPLVVESEKMVDAIKRAGTGIRALHRRTLYGNLYQVGGVQVEDVAIGNLTDVPDGSWAATNDHSFRNGAVGRHIRSLFPEPSPYEEA